MTGGGLSVFYNEFIGNEGPATGTFTQSGGIHQIGYPSDSGPCLCLGDYDTTPYVGGSGYYVLTGSGQLINLAGCSIGYSGTGSFTQSGGTNTIDGAAPNDNFYLGGAWESGGVSSGSYLLSGSGQLNVNTAMYVGYSGLGSFTQSGGINNISGSNTLTLGYNTGSSGTYTLSGGTTVVGQVFGGAGTSVFNFNGGVLRAGPFSVLGNFLSGLTNAYVQAGGANIDTNGENVTITQPLLDGGGGGGLTKYGEGTLTLAVPNTYSGETTIAGGVLNVDADAALGDTIGPVVFAGNGSLQFGSAMTSNRAFTFNSGCNGTIDTQSYNVILGGQISGNGGLTKIGYGMLTLSATSNYSGGTTLSQGTIAVTGALTGGGNIQIDAGTTLSGSGLVQGNITGQAGASIVAAGNLTLGDPTSLTGFNHAGTLTVGNNTVTLNSAGFANLGSLTTLAGGTINAPNGIYLNGGNLSGSGVVKGAVSAGYGSVINATGNLTLGDSTAYDGFYSSGRLYTNGNIVTLLSNNAANNKNAVVLGSLTEIDGGSLVAPNGIVLGTGNSLVTTNNGETVSGGSNSRFLNLGNVQGPPSSSGNWLTFNMLFKGGTGQTSGQIDFAGGFATGDSPGVNTQYGTAQLGGAGTEFDIGGTTPGNSNNNYGQLNIVDNPSDLNTPGDLILSPQTDLNIVDWNGFVPTAGETFTVLTWTGSLSGTASLSVDPTFAAAGIAFVPQWNSNSLVLEAVPEPSTLALIGVGAVGLLAYRWRRSAMRATKPAVAVQVEPQEYVAAVLSMPSCWTWEARKSA